MISTKIEKFDQHRYSLAQVCDFSWIARNWRKAFAKAVEEALIIHFDWSKSLEYYENENVRLNNVGVLCYLSQCSCFCRSAWCHWCGWRVVVCQVVHNCDVSCQAATTLPGNQNQAIWTFFHRLWAASMTLFVAKTLARLKALYMAWLCHIDKGVPRRVSSRRRPTTTRMVSSVTPSQTSLTSRTTWGASQERWRRTSVSMGHRRQLHVFRADATVVSIPT